MKTRKGKLAKNESRRQKYRDKPMISVTMSPEGIEAADEMAAMRGMSRSMFLEWLVREQGFRDRIEMDKMKRRGKRWGHYKRGEGE